MYLSGRSAPQPETLLGLSYFFPLAAREIYCLMVAVRQDFSVPAFLSLSGWGCLGMFKPGSGQISGSLSSLAN